AGADGADEPARSVQSDGRLRRRRSRGRGRRRGRQALQALEPQPDQGLERLHGLVRQEGPSPSPQRGQLLMEAAMNARRLFLIAAVLAAGDKRAEETQAPLPPAPVPSENLEVKLCDNHTTTTVSGDTPFTRDTGQKIADTLMAKWKEKNPNVDW